MRVELLVSRAGVAGAQNRGDIIEVEDAEAVRMIEAGQAVPVRHGPPRGAASGPPVETTAKARPAAAETTAETGAETGAKTARKGRR